MKDRLNSFKKRKNSTVPQPIYTTSAPIRELENALNILNSDTETKRYVKRDYCKTNPRKSKDLTHLSNLHYCSLIKDAILKQQWPQVVKLLMAYIDEPKSDKYTSGIIFKYTLIYLLNDPIAQSMDVLNEFFQLALSCRTPTERADFMKLLMTLPKDNASQKSNKEITSYTDVLFAG